jgi:hypothetical protein
VPVYSEMLRCDGTAPKVYHLGSVWDQRCRNPTDETLPRDGGAPRFGSSRRAGSLAP